jgi:hypothetical protein
MSDIADLLTRADQLATSADRSIATVSKWLFDDANTLKRLKAGRQITVASLLRAQARLREREGAAAKADEPA